MLSSPQRPKRHARGLLGALNVASGPNASKLSELKGEATVPATARPEPQAPGQITKTKIKKLNTDELAGAAAATERGTEEAEHVPRRSPRLAAQNRSTSAEASSPPKQKGASGNDKPQPPGEAGGEEPWRRIPRAVVALATKANSNMQPVVVPVRRMWHGTVSPLASKLYSRAVLAILSTWRMSQRAVSALWSSRCSIIIMLVLLSVSLFGLAQRWSFPDTSTPSPRPPALTWPAPPGGLAAPSHYTFSPLPIIPDYVEIAFAVARINATFLNCPYCRRSVRLGIQPPLEGCEESAETLRYWLQDWKYTCGSEFSVQKARSLRALKEIHNACWLSLRGVDFEADILNVVNFVWAARHNVNEMRDCLTPELEEHTWGSYAEDEDEDQYSGLELVGDVNRHEAFSLNRSATLLLSNLYSEHLPELGSMCGTMAGDFRSFREVLQDIKDGVDKLAEPIERIASSHWVAAARPGIDYGNNILRIEPPGLIRRAIFWATRRSWQYRCPALETTIHLESDEWNFELENTLGEGKRYYGLDYRPVLDGITPFFRGILLETYDDYYYASAWHCLLDARRIIETEVLPLIRQTQADAEAALVLFDTTFEPAWEKLHGRVRELIAGRGWDFVENVQIGRTPDGHWVESSRAAEMPLEELQNVTIWRRMYLPLDQSVSDLLGQAAALG